MSQDAMKAGSELSARLSAAKLTYEDLKKLANLLNFCANDLPLEFRQEAEDARRLEDVLGMRWGQIKAIEKEPGFVRNPDPSAPPWEREKWPK
ncbi:hypothetical protein [Geothrix alkalitolerans]|uniref:hypothetical protein n=1 Tax=Geothrix alkalitolerans TaxID=2922724 RepID=UPI001FAF7E08|nr:hypothetical protein [Geothrix alkalitolerans]